MAELAQNFVAVYSKNCYTMAQQKGSKLASCVTRVEGGGERTTLERVGKTEAQQVTTKYADSPIIETPLSRRSLFFGEYAWGDMCDWKDDAKLLIDPTGSVTMAGAAALGRTMDRVIIEKGIFGVAYEGKEGTTQIAFPESQKVSVTAGSAAGTNTGLNIEKLIQAKSLIGNADIDTDDPNETLYFVYTQKQLDDLLRSVEVKSSDYNPVRDLYYGKVDFFMGFKFIRLSKDILPLVADTQIRNCCAFAKSCVAFGEPIPIKGRIAERADKQFNWYSFMKMRCGATRFEDGGVVHVPCA